MIEECVYFYADKLKLEGILTYNENIPSSPAILICAPHPNLGGDMNNNVIESLARTSANMGFTSLRFNYRGVGNSECHVKDIAQKYQYWEDTLNSRNCTDAITDTSAALQYLVSQSGIHNEFFIAGYSFGAIVGMKAGFEDSKVIACAAISTPFGQYNLDVLRHCNKAKLFIYSENDFATTVDDTLNCFTQIPSPKILELIQDCDHFYRKKEDTVSQKVCTFFHNARRYS